MVLTGGPHPLATSEREGEGGRVGWAAAQEGARGAEVLGQKGRKRERRKRKLFPFYFFPNNFFSNSFQNEIEFKFLCSKKNHSSHKRSAPACMQQKY